MISKEAIDAAPEVGTRLAPLVKSVRYRPTTDKIELVTSWCVISIDRKRIAVLRNIQRRQMREIRMSPGGGICLESADMDIESAGLIVYIARRLVVEAGQSVGGTFP